jgi:hypothetical protein
MSDCRVILPTASVHGFITADYVTHPGVLTPVPQQADPLDPDWQDQHYVSRLVKLDVAL